MTVSPECSFPFPPFQMIAEKKKKDEERAVRWALAQAEATSAASSKPPILESLDEVPLSATYTKLEKSLPPDGKVPWGEFFK